MNGKINNNSSSSGKKYAETKEYHLIKTVEDF
jgi:hypothetical protein